MCFLPLKFSHYPPNLSRYPNFLASTRPEVKKTYPSGPESIDSTTVDIGVHCGVNCWSLLALLLIAQKKRACLTLEEVA